MNTVLGIDSSTQSCKLVLVDMESGAQVRSVTVPHPDNTAVDPRVWTRALREGFEALRLTPAEAPVAIGIAGQQHGMVALDDADEPVHPALLWNDTRSTPQARAMAEQLGDAEWMRRTGSLPLASFTITKLAWLVQNEPEAAARVGTVLLPHDYLVHELTGEVVTDRSEASGTGYFSPIANRYDEDILRRFFFSVPRLPRVAAPDEIAGQARVPWAPEAAVSAGMGDNAAAALGLNTVPGQAIVSVGTSGTVFASTQAPVDDSTGVVNGFADGRGGYLPLIATLNASRVLASTAAMLEVDLHEFSRLAQDGPSDAGGLILLPYLDGERTPNLPHASGSLHGLTRTNFTRANVARAAVLGVLNSLRDGMEAVQRATENIESVVLIGGGAKSAALRGAAADVFGCRVAVPEPAEYVALGAARQAAWAITGRVPDFATALDSELEPRGDAGIAEYRERYVEARQALYGV